MGRFPTATSRFTLNPYVVLVAGGAVARPHAGEVAAVIRMPLAEFFAGRVPYRAVELGPGRRSPIFDFEVGSMYGATAHVLDELLRAFAEVRGLAFPEPELTEPRAVGLMQGGAGAPLLFVKPAFQPTRQSD